MIKKLTLKQYLALNEIRYQDIKTVSVQTICNIMSGSHEGAKYNSNYKWKNAYYPTKKTIEKLSIGLQLSKDIVTILIDNQLKSLAN